MVCSHALDDLPCLPKTFMQLAAIIYPDAGTGLLVAECPEIGTASQGTTEAEALKNLREATELYLEAFPPSGKNPASIRTFELNQSLTA